jgi:TATA-binding protein-associated factor
VPQTVVSEDEAWAEVLESISKLLPLLQSKSSESRSAAAFALGLLAEELPPYTGVQQATCELDTNPVTLPEALQNNSTLLASAGREYAGKAKAGNRKAFLKSLGMEDNMMGDVADLMDEGEAAPAEAAPPPDIFEGLSARQITMLKRKKGNIVEEANK